MHPVLEDGGDLLDLGHGTTAHSHQQVNLRKAFQTRGLFCLSVSLNSLDSLVDRQSHQDCKVIAFTIGSCKLRGAILNKGSIGRYIGTGETWLEARCIHWIRYLSNYI